MKRLSEDTIAEINDVEKLRYLLTGMVNKNTKQLRRVKYLKKQNDTLKDENLKMKKQVLELSSTIEYQRSKQYDASFEQLRANFNEFAFVQLNQIVQGVEIASNDFFNNINNFKSELSSIIAKQNKEIEEALQRKDILINQLGSKVQNLEHQLEEALSTPITKEVEQIILEKDQTISKLRGIIQKYVKSDQMKQQQIEEQQQEIQKFALSLHESKVTDDSQYIQQIADLEQQLRDLKLKMEISGASFDLKQKNEKLTAMLDRSNQLYSQLSEEHRLLQETLAKSPDKLKIIKTSSFEVKYGHHIKRRKSMPSMNTKMVSLQRTLLQYFLKDEANQDNLIPVILEIVGCNKEQISTVVQKRQLSQQLINRTGGFFGIFG